MGYENGNSKQLLTVPATACLSGILTQSDLISSTSILMIQICDDLYDRWFCSFTTGLMMRLAVRIRLSALQFMLFGFFSLISIPTSLFSGGPFFTRTAFMTFGAISAC